jgi:ABC-type phosphate transport system substrate-binding protein
MRALQTSLGAPLCARSWRLILGPLLCAIVAAPPPARAADERLQRVGGEAFTDPHDRAEMPPEWVKKQIGREEWSRGADVAITLDQHLYPALLPLIQRYARKHRFTVAVKEGTCGVTTGLLARKLADVGGFCCPPAKSDRMPGIAHHTVGIAALALLVNPSNPVEHVTLDQARGIFQGRIERWSELRTARGSPGPDVRIQPVVRLHCPSRPGHWRLLLDDEELFSPTAQEVSAIPDMIRAVAADRRAVGHEVMYMARTFVEEGKTKPLKIDGASPLEPDRLAAGDYPLYRTFVITTWENPESANPRARALVAHLLQAADAGAVDPKFGIVPAARLRAAGWKFRGDELVGEPGR